MHNTFALIRLRLRHCYIEARRRQLVSRGSAGSVFLLMSIVHSPHADTYFVFDVHLHWRGAVLSAGGVENQLEFTNNLLHPVYIEQNYRQAFQHMIVLWYE